MSSSTRIYIFIYIYIYIQVVLPIKKTCILLLMFSEMKIEPLYKDWKGNYTLLF